MVSSGRFSSGLRFLHIPRLLFSFFKIDYFLRPIIWFRQSYIKLGFFIIFFAFFESFVYSDLFKQKKRLNRTFDNPNISLMDIDFRNITYLETGNIKQRNIHRLNHKYNILKVYNPIVVGTIPININIETSDVDIILYTQNFDQLEMKLRHDFSQFQNFLLERIAKNIAVCGFSIEGQVFEPYATDKETEEQNGYLHMIKEYEIIEVKGEDFAAKVRMLKTKGVKTEPAFCPLLKLEGAPYVELLKYQIRNT